MTNSKGLKFDVSLSLETLKVINRPLQFQIWHGRALKCEAENDT